MTLETSLGTAGQRANLVYPSDAVHKKIVAGGTYTVPESKTGISPSSGQASDIPVTGAVIYAVDHDDAGFVPMESFKPRVALPGMTIACTVAANKFTLTLNGTPIFEQQGTALTAASVMFFVQ